MKKIAAELTELVNSSAVLIKSIPEDEFAKKPKPEKWSKKASRF